MGKRSTVYIPDELWTRVQERAERDGSEVNLSELLQECLQRWVGIGTEPSNPPVDAAWFKEAREEMLKDAQDTYERGFGLGLKIASCLTWPSFEKIMSAREYKSYLGGLGEVIEMLGAGLKPEDGYTEDGEEHRFFIGADFEMADELDVVAEELLKPQRLSLESPTFKEGIVDAFEDLYREVQAQRKDRVVTEVRNLDKPPF